MVQLTFPQAGDLPDAAYFAFARGRGRSGIINGLTLTPDFSVPEVTVAAGKAIIDRGEMETEHPNITPSETVSDAAAAVEIESQTVPLTTGATNELYLDVNVGNDDSGTVVATTAGSAPTTASFKIGEVDPVNDTTSEQWNKIEDDGTLSFPDADAAGAVLSSLPPGVAVIDRLNEVRIVDSVKATESVTDPGGTTYTDTIRRTDDAIQKQALAVELIGF